MIRFEEETHRYFDGDRELISVTALMAKHGLAVNYAGIPGSILRAKAERGTLIHKEIEDYIKTGEIGFTKEAAAFARWIQNTGITVKESEYIVHNDIVAGTIDLLMIDAEGNRIIADIKTTSSIHTDPVSWQLSIYNNLAGFGAVRFLVVHFDVGLEVKEINPKKDEEVERLFQCEREGKIFVPNVPSIIDDARIVELGDLEAIIKQADAQKKIAEEQSKLIKASILRAMQKNGIDTFEQNGIRLTVVAEGEKSQLDTARLKEEAPEIVAKYTKKVKTAPYLKVTTKKSK